MSGLDELLRNATRRCLRREVAPLVGEAAEVRLGLWERLRNVQRSLLREVGHLSRNRLPAAVALLVADIRAVVLGTVGTLGAHVAALQQDRRCNTAHHPTRETLRMGVGCPGVMGCADQPGTSIRLGALMDKDVGVLQAMDLLHLDIAGLPGARLPAGFVAPSPGISCAAKWEGGHSYASVAALWKESVALRPVAGLGSNRRLWLEHPRVDGESLFICLVYLPPQGNCEDDVAWRLELEGLSTDLEQILARSEVNNLTLSNIVITGDFNFQPPELGGALDPRCRRRTAWATFQRRWSLELNNPTMHAAPISSIRLPLRNKVVNVRAGSTRHGPTPGRAIDLTLSSTDVSIEMVIHNRIHCCSDSPCVWPNCADYAWGDHFLIVAEITQRGITHQGGAFPLFPGKWTVPGSWRAAFDQAQTALAELDSLISRGVTLATQLQPLELRVQRWVVESLAWCQTVLGGATRDGWVQPARNPLHAHGATRAAPLSHAPPCQVSLSADAAELESAMVAANQCGDLKTAALNRCLKCLRPRQVYPLMHMIVDGVLQDTEGTHTAWCNLLESQTGDLRGVDPDRRLDVTNRAAQYTTRARAERGHGPKDQPISEVETASLVYSWDESPSLPADLIPRAAFQSGHSLWDRVVWRLQMLTGPGAMALRPNLWRYNTLLALLKKGDRFDITNYRLIFVKIQMGLLQEALLTRRLLPAVRLRLRPGQSGYARGVEDPILLLHEICATRLTASLCTWYAMGDFVKAFPRVWREDLLTIMRGVTTCSGGTFALLADILQKDVVSVWLSGASDVLVVQGIPEGGNVGTLTYVTVPDTLVRELEENKHGVGVGMTVPAAWESHVWSGCGRPITSLVGDLVHCLSAGLPLPSVRLLDNWPDLEASAARALDLIAPLRLVSIFHVDDPVLLASSAGALEDMLETVSDWALRHNARFHQGPAKTVVLVTCAEAVRERTDAVEVRMRSTDVPGMVRLTRKDVHKWLGVLWSCRLVFYAELCAKIAIASMTVSVLAGLSAANVLPIHLAIPMFETKVDSLVGFSRWLFIGSPEAEERLNETYRSWARALLGAGAWRNGDISSSELGWFVSGFGRAVLDAAMRRARILQFPDEDIYKTVHVLAFQHDSGWAHLCRKTLQAWGVPDWAEWAGEGATLLNYRRYVVAQLASHCAVQWQASVQSHGAQIQYLVLQPCPGGLLRGLDGRSYPWAVLSFLRGWCRMRAGISILRWKEGRRSTALFQDCIVCGETTKYATVHAVARCPSWRLLRAEFLAAAEDIQDASAYVFTKRVLTAQPSQPGFAQAVLLCGSIDQAVQRAWRSRGRTVEL